MMDVDTVSMPRVVPPPTADPPGAWGWTERLLSPAPPTTWTREIQRLGVGLGLAAVFGTALGLRQGGVSLATSAAGASAGMLAVAVVAVPAFAIVLALASAPIDSFALARATTRAVAKAGLVLGGLAPAVALYVVTVEDAITVTMVGFGALILAGCIAMRSFHDDLAPTLVEAPLATRWATRAAMIAFLLFAAVLASRIWWIALPSLTGAL
jgi:hypothetical protein